MDGNDVTKRCGSCHVDSWATSWHRSDSEMFLLPVWTSLPLVTLFWLLHRNNHISRDEPPIRLVHSWTTFDVGPEHDDLARLDPRLLVSFIHDILVCIYCIGISWWIQQRLAGNKPVIYGKGKGHGTTKWKWDNTTFRREIFVTSQEKSIRKLQTRIEVFTNNRAINSHPTSIIRYYRKQPLPSAIITEGHTALSSFFKFCPHRLRGWSPTVTLRYVLIIHMSGFESRVLGATLRGETLIYWDEYCWNSKDPIEHQTYFLFQTTTVCTGSHGALLLGSCFNTNPANLSIHTHCGYITSRIGPYRSGSW